MVPTNRLKLIRILYEDGTVDLLQVWALELFPGGLVVSGPGLLKCTSKPIRRIFSGRV